jgi:hypothetical protein
MSLSVRGKVVSILNVESGIARTGNPWKKQEFIVETADQFPKKICFTLFNDKINQLTGIQEGEELEVSFDIESREYNGKWFHNINAWKIDRIVQRPAAVEGPPLTEADIPVDPFTEQPDDLPF